MSTLLQRLRALVPPREQLEGNRYLRRLAPYLSRPELWHWSRRGVCAGVAIGLFIGILIPVAQILLAAIAAIFLRANVPVAAAGTLITNPLTVPPIYFAAYHLGAWVTGIAPSAKISLTNPLSIWQNLAEISVPLFSGLALTATCLAIASYFLISLVWISSVNAKRRLKKS